MFNLYKQILASNKTKGLVPVESLLSDSLFINRIKEKLMQNGFNYKNLSERGILILFFALVDILFVVKDDNFYLVTLSESKIKELFNLNRIVPRKDEYSYEKTQQLLFANSKEVINKFLLEGKFHFIKLNQVDYNKNLSFLVSLGGMNPYPSLATETVYTLENVGSWHNELYNALLNGCYKLKTDNNDIICQSYTTKTQSICTSGSLTTKDLDNTVIEIPLWKIKDYEPYSANSNVEMLLKGVVQYDKKKVTLNRTILEKYYGAFNLYSWLESENVRRRYCLEELLSLGNKYSYDYYLKKYNLSIPCNSISELIGSLKEDIKTDICSGDIIHARVLDSIESIRAGHKSYYITIDLKKIRTHTFEQIDNIEEVLPQRYKYYGISKGFGLDCVEISATSDSLALKNGEKEFIRQFGKEMKFRALYRGSELVKGKPVISLNFEVQANLYQSILYGYTANYKSYASKIKSICKVQGLLVPKDDEIKFVFINNLARIEKYGRDLKMIDVIDNFVDFMLLLRSSESINQALNDEYTKLAYPQAIKEYRKICEVAPNYEGYFVEDTPKGRFIKTRFAKFKVTDEGVSKTFELFFEGVNLGRKIIR